MLSHLISRIHSMFRTTPADPSLPHLLNPRGLLEDEGGAVYVEYIVLTLFIAIGFSAAVMAIGVPLLENFRMTQAFLAVPIP